MDFTGSTDLIGGDYLHLIAQRHEWHISVLIRDTEKARAVRQHYPFVEVVIGTLEDTGLLEQQGELADVVLNFADCDHLDAAEAIIRGSSRRKKPGFIIHTSGAKIIAWDIKARPATWGEYIPRRYDDWAGVHKLTSVTSDGHDIDCLPDWAAHRDVDQAILRGYRNHPNTVYTAILPRMLNVFLRRGRAFTIKGNENK
ncbi:hypothetical protein BDV12DRAFT_205204 [Aspergillus spectabilis]